MPDRPRTAAARILVVDDDPLTTVVRGAGKVLENEKLYESAFIN